MTRILHPFFIAVLLILVASITSAQETSVAFKKQYLNAKTDREKGWFLLESGLPVFTEKYEAAEKPVKLYEWFKRNHDPVGADYIKIVIANKAFMTGNSSIALEMTYPLLKRFEERKDDFGAMNCYCIIGESYLTAKKPELSFSYFKKAIAIAEHLKLNSTLVYYFNEIAVAYSIAEKPTEGLAYAQKSVEYSTKYYPEFLPASLSTVGENYIAAKEYEIALSFLRKVGKKDIKLSNYADTYMNNDFAQTFIGLKQYDSAVHYANSGLDKAIRFGFKDQKLRSSEYLVDIFEKTNRQDILNKYYKLLIQSKDELSNAEKKSSMEMMHFKEELRQSELKIEKKIAEETRVTNIQYAFIATGIITFFILFLILSRTIIVNEKWISFLAILALLLVFEFINLLIHPFLEKITHHSPILMLLCLVGLASLLIPLHHKLEHFIKHKLTEKNKAIRLAAAKKTIEQLESE